MLERSAMPSKIKRNSLVQEGIRRLRNTRRSLPWSEKAEILSQYSHSLMSSRYSEKYRYQIITAAVNGYERQCARADRGGTPLHRPRQYEQEARLRRKLLTKTSWYRPHNAVGFFPPTPGNILVKNIQSIVTRYVTRLGLSVKCIETGGVSLKSILCKLDLTGCIFPDCIFCKSGKSGASHTRWGGVYTSESILFKFSEN